MTRKANPTKAKKESEPRISVRVDETLKGRLNDAVEATGIEEPVLVKKCVEALLDYIEKNGNITFPLTVSPSKAPSKLAETPSQYPAPTQDHHSLNDKGDDGSDLPPPKSRPKYS